MIGNLYCEKHPKYKARLKPRAKCRACELLYACLSSVNSWTLIHMEDGSAIAFAEQVPDFGY